MSELDNKNPFSASSHQNILHTNTAADGSKPESLDPGSFKPKRLGSEEWEQSNFTGRKGEKYAILKSLKTNNYIRLNEQQTYIWELMDGTRTISDLVVEIFMHYHVLAIEGTQAIVEQLRQKGFLTEPPRIDENQVAREQQIKSQPGYKIRRLLGFILQSEFSFPGIDLIVMLLFKVLGRFLFSRPIQIILLLITLVGVPFFYLVVKQGDLSFFVGAHGMLHVGLATMLAAQILAVFVHEMAHALTTKHYGRQVRRGGMGLYFGMVAFFVDTTDIWMEGRKARMVVTWAGPYSGLILGAMASITLMIHPISGFIFENFFHSVPTFYLHYILPLAEHRSIWAGFMYQFATFCYAISFFNLNPLLKLDGYYILMDWLEIPMLRERSMSFVSGGLWRKILHKDRLSQEEWIYSVFGLLALLWTGIAIISIIMLYGEKVLEWLAGLVGEQLAWVLLLSTGGLILIVYVWRGLSFARSQQRASISSSMRSPGLPDSSLTVEPRLSQGDVNLVSPHHPGDELDKGKKSKTFEKPGSQDSVF